MILNRNVVQSVWISAKPLNKVLFLGKNNVMGLLFYSNDNSMNKNFTFQSQKYITFPLTENDSRFHLC